MSVKFYIDPARSQEGNRVKLSRNTRYVCQAGIFAALYVVLTCISAMFPFGAVQFRLAEAMCVLAYFTPAIVPGMTIGCFVANLLTGAIWQDVVFGTLATFLGVFFGRKLRHSGKWLVAVPTVVSNAVIIPPVLAWSYRAEEGLAVLFATVTISEILSAYVFGMIFLLAFKKEARKYIYLH